MEHGIRVGRKRVARLMKAAGISGVRPRKRYKTTIRIPGITPAIDLVERHFRPDRPNVLWVADITYLRTGEGWLYLAAVQDAYSRQIVGWSMATHTRASLVVDALKMALARRRPDPGLIHHSDQGSQGGFNWSSQRLIVGGLRWAGRRVGVGVDGAGGDAVAGAAAGGAPGGSAVFWLAVARWADDEEAAELRRGCRRRLVSGGFGTVAGCHLSPWPRCRGGICRSRSARRSRCCAPGWGCARSPGSSGARRRRSRVSCAATRPRVAAGWTIEPRPRSGMPTCAPGVPKPAKLAVNAGCAVCAGPPLRGGQAAGRERGGGSGGPVDRSSSWPSQGPAVGQGMES